MSRKFIELAIGQAFVFEGVSYVKTSPLMARNETTGQERFMPRSASVESEGVLPPIPAPTHTLSAAEVHKAWQRFHARCAASLVAVEPQLRSELENELAAARLEFERALGLDGNW